MICLACGSSCDYGAEGCPGCRQTFEVFPPYRKANHVSQLQEALRATREGRLDLEALADRYTRFVELCMSFEERWKVQAGPPLAERLAEPVKERYRSGMGELDQAQASLQLALASLELALEGDPEQLAGAEDLLTDFFKQSCQGCALLMDELEHPGGDERGSFLDVRGL